MYFCTKLLCAVETINNVCGAPTCLPARCHTHQHTLLANASCEMGNGENNITRKSRRAGNISDSIDGAITRAKLLAVALALAQKFNLLPQQS